jgi:ribosome-associated protein
MPDPIHITDTLFIDGDDIAISYIRSSGPGGQNVNKVATAAQLRFDLMGSSLPQGVKQRAARLAGTRLTGTGEIVLTAMNFRTQGQNRDDAVARLVALLRRAAVPPRRRVPTRPTRASKQRRLDAKTRRSAVKRQRTRPPECD